MVDGLVLEGVLRDGLGVAGSFTELPWVHEQFLRKLGLDLYPGTVNLQVTDPAGQAILAQMRDGEVRGADGALLVRGVPIDPPDVGYCVGWTYPARLGGLPSAIVVPHVPDYPPDKLELVAAVRVRDALGLQAGDAVRVEVLAGS